MKVIILCGGSGSRLWPLSRSQYPKQFLRLANMENSIFQMTVRRALMLGNIEDIYFVTSEHYRHLIQGQMEEMGLNPISENILCEPMPKNTLPAIVFAVKQMQNNDIAVVFSSDHVIEDEKLLTKTIENGQELTDKYIVTFGIRPESPETVYGYIRPGEQIGSGHVVQKFVEKPNKKLAELYVSEGYLWNSGMFMFKCSVFMNELKVHNITVFEAFSADDVQQCFEKSPSISIDYGLLEKSSQNAVLPMSVGWNDLGNFVAFYDKYNADVSGNVSFHDEIILDGTRNLIYSEGDKAIALVGLDDVVVVDQKDALLICDRKSTSQVSNVVQMLKQRGDKRADTHLTEYRPWGSYTFLEDGENYKVKRLTVSPGKRLSSQMHYHRNEHWVIVKGTATVEIEDEQIMLRTGESIYVESGKRHRLSNPGKLLLEVIEVQSGSYLNEDDIVRLEDDFGRG